MGALLGIGELGQSIAGAVADVTLNLPNSRLHETESDRIGVELAARAGFDPRAAVTLWEKMAKVPAAAQPPKWLSTSPAAPGSHQRPARLLGEGDAALRGGQGRRSGRQIT